MGLEDKVHLLRETMLSRLGELAVLSNVQETTWRVKENEETGICPKQKNEINRQKQILMK